MATYVTTRCGICGAIWEEHSPGRHSSFGPPVVKCSSCGGYQRTKFKLFRDMNLLEKALFLFGQVLFKLCISLVLFIGSTYFFTDYYFEEFSSFTTFEMIVGGIGGGIFFLASIFTFIDVISTRTAIKDTESKFDANGGFISSEDWYS